MSDSIGARLKAARVKKGLSQAELARKIGVSQAAIGQWERGQFAPRGRHLNALNDVFAPELVLRDSAERTEIEVEENPPVSILDSTIREGLSDYPEAIVQTFKTALGGFTEHRRSSRYFEAEFEQLLKSLDPSLKSDLVLDLRGERKMVVDHMTSRSVIMLAHPVNHLSVERLSLATLWRLVVLRAVIGQGRNYIAIIHIPAVESNENSDVAPPEDKLERAKRVISEAGIAGFHLVFATSAAQAVKQITGIEETDIEN